METEIFTTRQKTLLAFHDLVLDAIPSPSNPNITYNWSNGASTQSISVPDGGPYLVTASLGGCSISKQVDIPKNPEDYLWIYPSGCYTTCYNRGDKDEEYSYLMGPTLSLPSWSWNNYGSSGYDITLIDANNDGITLFSPTYINGYIPTEGDEIEVEGVITQVNGLIQIKPDNISVLQQGAALQSPMLSTVLNESTESQLVRLENLELVNGEAMWPTNGNIEVTNTVDTFIVHITAASVLAGTPTPGTYFHLTGIGKQDDASSPFASGYQIYPCSVDPFCNIDNSTSLNNETISVTDTGLSYQWIDCADSSFITGETGESFTPTANGSYAVIITQGPCVDTSACVFVDVLGLEGNELKGISVYPNPISDVLHISNENEALISVEMIDAKGSVVVSSKTASKSFTFDTGDLNSGVYILIVRSETGVRTFKVIK